MLDTNICIYSIKNSFPKLTERLLSTPAEQLGLSTIVVSELFYGVAKSGSKKNIDRLNLFLAPFTILDFDADAAIKYGKIRAELEQKGQIIGPYDLQIAAHALSLGVTLVTHNLKEFKRVKGLAIENWLKA